ncbi:MAG: two-component sensor histidine kinase, partial [Clostridiales bacterium]|nr:two-component sensor histidine kinase [Clostridiales bacterium]
DNGVGMSEDHMDKLNQVLSDPTDHQTIRSFGIKNVSHRMKLFFGQEYGVYVVSEAGKGTEIRIKLPKDGQYD